MKKPGIILLMMLLGFLAGCSTAETRSAPNLPLLVTQITITRECADGCTARSYTEEESMTEILSILRSMDSRVMPDGIPDDCCGDTLRIEIHYSGGETKTFCQLSDCYLSEDGGAWRAVDPEIGQTVTRFFRLTPGS